MEILTLYHGTNKKNQRGILKNGFQPYCWFAPDEATARRYALMTVKRIADAVVMEIKVNADALYKTGDYYTAKGGLSLNFYGVYVEQPVRKPERLTDEA
jgi:RNA:NAD 2'-phosphotransferase (TPT1/KptA family)